MKKDEIDQNKNCVIVFVQVDFSSIRKVGHSSWFSDVRRLPLWKHFSGTFLHWKNFDEHKFSRKIQVDNNGVLIFSANPLFFQSRAPPLIRESQNTHSNPRKTSTSCVPCAPHPIASGMDPFSLFQDAHGSAFTVVAFELIFLLLLDIWIENYFVVVLNLRLRTYFCCCESLPDFSRRIALISFRELQLSLLFPCASLSIALFHLLRILTTPTSESSNNTQSCLDFRLRLFYYVLPISRIKFFTSHKTVTLAMRSTHTNFPLF